MAKNKVQSKQIMLTKVRLSFPSLFRKADYQGQETKFEATFLLDKQKDAKQIAALEAEISRMANEYFGGNPPKSLKTPLMDGDEKDYDGYEGCMSIKAASNRRPTVIDRDKTPLVEEDGRPYAGCYVNAIVDFWVQDNQYGKRVNCNLLGVQFHSDGEPFGAGNVDVTDAFGELDDDNFPI